MMSRPVAVLCSGPCRPDDHGGPRQTIPGQALCDVCEQRAAEHLTYLAEHWADLEAQLTRPTRPPDGMPRGTTDATGIAINEAVSDARAQIAHTLTYWVRVILDEHPEFTGPGPGATVPAMARYIATHHQTITRHADHGLAASIAIDARDMRNTMRKLAFPSGGRRFEPGITCTEDVDTDGQIGPCGGTYRAWLTDRTDTLPDLHCTRDATHLLAPAAWRRAGRTAMNPDAIASLVTSIRKAKP